MKKRIERDSLGDVEVPADRYWGAQTERSFHNFRIGDDKIPLEVIHALALIKKAEARVKCELGILTDETRDVITAVCEEISQGELDDQFPLVIYQTGSGTQTNMNVNEVISNRAIEMLGGEMGSKSPIHPNDDVNKSQSSNDTFPTAMHVASKLLIEKSLLPNLEVFLRALQEKAKKFESIIKTGRTHLMDAVPLTLGQEFSGYASQVEHGIQAIKNALVHLSEIAQGGTAVGTGINAPHQFAQLMAEEISQLTGLTFVTAPNKFEALAAHDAVVEMSGALKRVACSFMKIANDMRWLASGPNTGFSEIIIPANEPGSSIMPGKVNPTQCEAMTMVAVQVMGNDVAITIAGSQGNFELNVYKPVLIANLLKSIRLLSDVSINFTEKCLQGIEPHQAKIDEYLSRSLMFATVLNTHIGYDKASRIVHKAFEENLSLKEAALALKLLSEEEFDSIVDPKKMV